MRFLGISCILSHMVFLAFCHMVFLACFVLPKQFLKFDRVMSGHTVYIKMLNLDSLKKYIMNMDTIKAHWVLLLDST